MSRSRKKHPVCGMTCKESEKEDKQLAHRANRRKTKQLLNEDTEITPEMKETSNVWTFSKDGKQWLDERSAPNPEDISKLMRK